MAYTQLIPQHTKDARVEEISGGTLHYLLSIEAGKGDRYRLAQIDDYAKLARAEFLHRSPVCLSLSARVSGNSIPGTWGFGFWNDPFGMSLGFGGKGWRLPALPNAAWFFGASEENYLSFKTQLRPSEKYRDDREQSREIAANGFLAQSFRSPGFHPRLIPAGLALPFSPRKTRELLEKVIEEDGIDLRRIGQLPNPTEVTDWHRYRLDCRERQVLFEVDDVIVFESHVSPDPPLGLVIWIDNQYAAFTPEGKIMFGVLENPEHAWLEVKEIEIS